MCHNAVYKISSIKKLRETANMHACFKKTIAPIPEELVNAGLRERAAQRGELEFLGVDDGHGGVPEPAQLQCLLKRRLRARLCPHPPATESPQLLMHLFAMFIQLYIYKEREG